MVFTGTLAAVNAALDGLNYAPTGGYSGTASIGVVLNDLGNTGTGGNLTDSETVFIQVGGFNFQQGTNGYTGTEDTSINSSSANTSYGSQTTVVVDAPTEQALLRFDNMFGGGAGQIALGSTILNASLSVYVSVPTRTIRCKYIKCLARGRKVRLGIHWSVVSRLTTAKHPRR